MESTIKSNVLTGAMQSAAMSKNINASFWNKLEWNRFGIIPILLLIIGCVGGVAAAFGAGDSLIKLSMVAFPTIVSLAMVLAVAPMRVIIFVSAIALLLDGLVFLF